MTIVHLMMLMIMIMIMIVIIVNTAKAMEPSEYKKSKSQEMEEAWKQKVMHGQFVRDKDGVNWDKSWQYFAREI